MLLAVAVLVSPLAGEARQARTGPYRFSRNPIYLSMILLHLGAGVWTKSLWFFVLAVLSVALLAWGVISREERYLERKFGDAYLSYKSRVRRWI